MNEVTNVLYVYDFLSDASTDSEAIRNCLKFGSILKSRTIIFDRKDWFIDEAIQLPSHTTVIIDNCMIKQNDRVFDNVFRGVNLTLDQDNLYGYPLRVSNIEHIKILGRGNARIEGCDTNLEGDHPKLGRQEMTGDFWGWRTLQISLSKCTNFEIAGITLTKTRSWAISFDKCSHGYVHDLHIESNVKNGDGVNFRAGCKHCVVHHITGHTSDDSVAINAIPARLTYPYKNYLYPNIPSGFEEEHMELKDLDVHDISVHDIFTEGKHHSVICLTAGGRQVYNISLCNIIETGAGSRHSVVKIYTGYGTGYVDNDLKRIRVNNVLSKGAKLAIEVNTKVKDVWFNKIKQENPAGKLYEIENGDGITITNSND